VAASAFLSARSFSIAVVAMARLASTACQEATAVPARSDATTTAAVPSAALFRRANLANRYQADGGQA
jgi:hypothetical protein